MGQTSVSQMSPLRSHKKILMIQFPHIFLTGYDDDEYKITFQRSGDVIATTLTIPDFKQKFPRDFETVLTSNEGTMQYQLRTSVEEPISYRLDNIDSPEWMAIPPPLMQFRNKHPMKVHCKVFVPNEKEGFQFTNELTMFRAFPSDKKSSAKMLFQEVIGECLYLFVSK